MSIFVPDTEKCPSPWLIHLRYVTKNSLIFRGKPLDNIGRSSGEEPERFYHGFVLGVMVEQQNRYLITSNRESGFGRYDVMLEPKDSGADAMILEFKVRNARREETLEDTVAAALNQIEEKQYGAQLAERGIPADRIRSYEFAFEGKKVLIGEGASDGKQRS